MEIVATEAARRGAGYLTKQAQHEPVTVTKHGAPVAVVLSYADYRNLLDASRRERYAGDAAELADILSSRRRELGWSLAAVAGQADVGQRFVWDLEAGVRRPEMPLILRVAEVLGVTLTAVPTYALGPWVQQLADPASNELPEPDREPESRR